MPHPRQDSAALRRSVLPGGLRVVTEAVPGARSVTVGVWVGAGSRDETRAQAGAAHYLEHLLFKGTQRRDALAIAVELDAVGGESNAFTDREYTCYHARVLGEDLPLAVDVTCDLVTGALLRARDVEAERGVLLEEVAMHDDDPEDVVHDLFAEALYGDTPMGRPVIGSADGLARLSSATIAGFYRRHYTPGRTVVSAAGRLDHDRVVELVQQAYGDRLTGPAEPLPAVRRPARARPATMVDDQPGEQAHLVLGCEALARCDPRRDALQVLDLALGGGQSSRLFQSVREQRGLAYSVYSTTGESSDTGWFGVYVACAPGKADEVLALVRSEVEQVAERGLTDGEVARAQGQWRGSAVLSMEDTASRMSGIGAAELVDGHVPTVDDLLARIAAVTPDDVRAVAADVLTRPLALAAVGPVGDLDLA